MTATPTYERAPVRTTPRLTITGCCFVAAALVMLDETVTAWDRPTVAVVWVVSLAAYAAGLLCLIGSGRCSDLGLIRWKIGSWILLSYGLVFGITTVTFLGPQYREAAEIRPHQCATGSVAGRSGNNNVGPRLRYRTRPAESNIWPLGA